MITLAAQIAEAQRELALRRQCYPGWIKRGKLDAGDAYYQIQAMEAIVRTLQRLDEAIDRTIGLEAATGPEEEER